MLSTVQRTPTHIIDTLAVRQIVSQLPEDWLIRGLEERDYGIDLTIELFDDNKPTGCFSLIQVKGKQKVFANSIKLSNFPVKTLRYAKLFPIPFFIFHTSLESQKTVFVWTQKYIDIRLARDIPGWDTQRSTTIYFPPDNDLSTEPGQEKIERIMREPSIQQNGLEFLADLEWLQSQWESYIDGHGDLIENCQRWTKNIRAHAALLDTYDNPALGLDLQELEDNLEMVVLYRNEPDAQSYQEAVDGVDEQLRILDMIKTMFLNQRQLDELENDHGGIIPY